MAPRPVNRPQEYPTVSRIVSLIVLCALVVVMGILFFQVMFRFFLPMFVALVLVVMFRPLHEWYLERCKQRNYVAAALTTTTILLIVLLPFAFVLYQAAVEVTAQARNVNFTLVDKVNQLRTKLGLDLPPPETEHALVKLREDVDTLLNQLVQARDELERSPFQTLDGDEDSSPQAGPGRAILAGFKSIDTDVGLLRQRLGLSPLPPDRVLDARPAEDWWVARRVRDTSHAIDEFSEELATLRQRFVELDEAADRARAEVEGLSMAAMADPAERLVARAFEQSAADAPSVSQAGRELGRQIQVVLTAYGDVQKSLVGTELLYQVKQFAQLDQEKVNQLIAEIRNWGTPQLISLPQRLGGMIGGLLVGLVVMVISLFYFLADGPGMVKTLMRLSPLDDRYEEQILVEFDRVSRAVVVATLLSAAVQGGLALIGYWIAGLDGIFLLSVLTGLLAMVPFVGAASVWAVCSAWLFFDGQIGMAIFLSLYGFFVISMADNVIKPLVLHGQSNLHPLLALLSVLGGVQALGPIGIFVGPMVVAFMQAALSMLRTEVSQISDKPELRTRPDEPAAERKLVESPLEARSAAP